MKQVTDAREKTGLLNEYFCDQSKSSKVDDRFASLPNDSSFRSYVILMILQRNVRFTIYLKTVDVAKACGPDGTGSPALVARGIASSFSKL